MRRQHGFIRPSYGHAPFGPIDQAVVRNAVPIIASYGGQLTLSELLNMLKNPRSPLSTLNVGNIQKILNAHPHIFELDELGRGKYQTKVMLAFEAQICEQPRKCDGFPICKALHICKYFIQDRCRASVNQRCSFGHDLHSPHNLAVLTELNLDQIEPLRLKDWIQQQHKRRSRPSRSPKICNFYNTAGGCDQGENCSFLHLCRYFVNRSCKFGSKCTRSHTIRSNRNSEILREHGIDLRCNQDEILDIISDDKHQRERQPSESLETDHSSQNQDRKNNMTPGTPFLISAKSDSITLQWKNVSGLCSDFEYLIQYKEIPDGRWVIYRSDVSHDSSRVVVSGLKAHTQYSFRIRLIHVKDGQEYPFTTESNVFETTESPALRLRQLSTRIQSGNPEIYLLPAKEVYGARNMDSKTKKLSIGSDRLCTQDKTIMLVGATGSGKSTLIDGFANYLFEVNWEDDFRFTLLNFEKEERKRLTDQAVSQTEWITCYSIYPDMATKLDYALHIVDTPGFGDTRGVQRDKEIIDQIRELFLLPGDKGIACLDAVCFLVKAPDARLTTSQKYILEAILSLFGKDIEKNICTCITFAEAQKPPVLASLEKFRLPHQNYFKFNNSALFANNINKDELGHNFWKIGMKSFDSFFEQLDKMETKSLQMTKEVLKTRQDLENTVHNLQGLINAGMHKISILEEEMDIFQKHEKQIQENKDFEYEVTEQVQEKEDLSGKGQHTTNCLTCNYTCHGKCKIPEDSRKAHCIAMDKEGKCKQCPGNCPWQAHHNTPYIIRWVKKKVKKTYREKMKLYATAKDKVSSQAQILQTMSDNVKKLERGITLLLRSVTNCNNRLKEIALNENPIDTADYIELMIESEKKERKSGYMSRIKVLEECRKKALIGHEATDFLYRAKQTRKFVSSKSDPSPSRSRQHDSVTSSGQTDFGSSAISTMHSLLTRV